MFAPHGAYLVFYDLTFSMMITLVDADILVIVMQEFIENWSSKLYILSDDICLPNDNQVHFVLDFWHLICQ